MSLTPNNKTLHDHLAYARSKRNPDEHSEQMRQAQQKRWQGVEPKPCTCNTTDKHKSTCPEYRREQYRARRQKETQGQ